MMQGIEKRDDHWVWFSEEGHRVGRYADAEAARWGCWVRPEAAIHINEGEGRLLTVDDTRAAIRAHGTMVETCGPTS
jgi:hypothetical protein